MPQFDKITFLNQLFWLAVFFTILFFFCNNFFLPKLCSVLKGRHKKLQKKNDFLVLYNEELNKISENANFIFDNMLFSFKNFVFSSTEKITLRVDNQSSSVVKFCFSSSLNSVENLVHNQTIMFLVEKENVSNMKLEETKATSNTL